MGKMQTLTLRLLLLHTLKKQNKTYLKLWKGSCVGHLLVVLTKLLANWLEAMEELASADWPRYACPGGPEILHPAQCAAVQEDSGLISVYKEKKEQNL